MFKSNPHKSLHDKMLSRKPSNRKDWQLKNQWMQSPELLKNRIASLELRRQFLEGQNKRNNENEKMRLFNIRANYSIPWLNAGRYRPLAQNEIALITNRMVELKRNPANRPLLDQKDRQLLDPIIGNQPTYFFYLIYYFLLFYIFIQRILYND